MNYNLQFSSLLLFSLVIILSSLNKSFNGLFSHFLQVISDLCLFSSLNRFLFLLLPTLSMFWGPLRHFRYFLLLL